LFPKALKQCFKKQKKVRLFNHPYLNGFLVNNLFLDLKAPGMAKEWGVEDMRQGF